MGRRKRMVTGRCTHEGCREVAIYQCDGAREEAEARSRLNTWKCLRHTEGSNYLSPSNRRSVTTLTSQQREHGVFWEGKNGIAVGPGFYAESGDFPVGSLLIVTAEVVLPEDGHSARTSLVEGK